MIRELHTALVANPYQIFLDSCKEIFGDIIFHCETNVELVYISAALIALDKKACGDDYFKPVAVRYIKQISSDMSIDEMRSLELIITTLTLAPQALAISSLFGPLQPDIFSLSRRICDEFISAVRLNADILDSRLGGIVPATKDNFSEQGYLHANADIAAAVKRGHIVSGLDHFLRHGAREGRKIRVYGDLSYDR
jgi:hypothetical protein